MVNNCKGFSIMEIVLSTLLVLSLSAVSYRVLKGLTSGQTTAVSSQKQNSAASLAMDRFKRDVTMIDYNWTRYGVAAVYPHPGYSFGTNYYTDANIAQTEKMSDGVTFLRRDPTNDTIYEMFNGARYCYPTAQYGNDKILYSDDIKLSSPIAGLAVNDWVLVYEAGIYAVGVVTNLNPPDKISIRMPNTDEEQAPGLDNSSKATGFIVKPGVVTADADIHSNITPRASDDEFCLTPLNARVQKISSPVSYFADYQTSDGQVKSVNNSYVLNAKGEKQKMLVRQEYIGGTIQREYLANADQVGFTYDQLTDDITISGGIQKDIGRDQSNMVLIKTLSNENPNQQGQAFQTTNKVVAIKMNLRSSTLNSDKASLNQDQELKVALNPSASDDMYKGQMQVDSYLTDNLQVNTAMIRTANKFFQQPMKPLYLPNTGDSAKDEVVVPVATYEVKTDGTFGTDSYGQLSVYNKEGVPANDLNGAPTSNSTIMFDPGHGASFFPNVVSSMIMTDGSTRIIAGGLTVAVVGGNTIRQPALGIIDLQPGETLTDKLKHQTSTGNCNIRDCSFQTINNLSPDMTDLRDTANMTMDPITNDIYVTSMTKAVGQNSPSVLYQGTWNGSAYAFTKLGDIPDSDSGRVVTAMSDKTIEMNGQKYVAICQTKKISDSCGSGGCLQNFIPGPRQNAQQSDSFGGGDLGNGTDDNSQGDSFGSNNDSFSNTTSELGTIKLVRYDTVRQKLFTWTLKEHNYRCSSMMVDQDQNLEVAGRLAVQPISQVDISRSLISKNYQTAVLQDIMYLDEVAMVEGNTAVYADMFKVDPDTYQHSPYSDVGYSGVTPPQYIGWFTGVSSFQYPDGSFGFANGNSFVLGPNFHENSGNTDPKEFSNVGIQQIKSAGMHDRVVATIQTDSKNINGSVITATYTPHVTKLPDVYIPGSFMFNASSPRTTPTPMPLAAPAMSDASWIHLYQQMLSPNGTDGLNNQMPVFTGSAQTTPICNKSSPSTCNY